jgi:hypothetical protein
MRPTQSTVTVDRDAEENGYFVERQSDTNGWGWGQRGEKKPAEKPASAARIDYSILGGRPRGRKAVTRPLFFGLFAFGNLAVYRLVPTRAVIRLEPPEARHCSVAAKIVRYGFLRGCVLLDGRGDFPATA